MLLSFDFHFHFQFYWMILWFCYCPTTNRIWHKHSFYIQAHKNSNQSQIAVFEINSRANRQTRKKKAKYKHPLGLICHQNVIFGWFCHRLIACSNNVFTYWCKFRCIQHCCNWKRNTCKLCIKSTFIILHFSSHSAQVQSQFYYALDKTYTTLLIPTNPNTQHSC